MTVAVTVARRHWPHLTYVAAVCAVMLTVHLFWG